MSPIVLSYAVYSALAIVLTVGLARTLSQHGHVFLEDVFPDRPELARSINQLLVVGFFMLNLGYAFFLMRQGTPKKPPSKVSPRKWGSCCAAWPPSTLPTCSCSGRSVVRKR
jgi:hypothetical protein